MSAPPTPASAPVSTKRRRTSMSSSASVASREDDAGSVDLEYQPEAKRKRTVKMDPVYDDPVSR